MTAATMPTAITAPDGATLATQAAHVPAAKPKMSLFSIDGDMAAFDLLLESELAATEGDITDSESIFGDWMNEIATKLTTKFAGYGRYIRKLEAEQKLFEGMAKPFEDEAKRLKGHAKVAENKIKRAKGLLMWFMTKRGFDKFDAGEFKFTVGNNPQRSGELREDAKADEMPACFVTKRTVLEVNMDAVQAALEDQAAIEADVLEAVSLGTAVANPDYDPLGDRYGFFAHGDGSGNWSVCDTKYLDQAGEFFSVHDYETGPTASKDAAEHTERLNIIQFARIPARTTKLLVR